MSQLTKDCQHCCNRDKTKNDGEKRRKRRRWSVHPLTDRLQHRHRGVCGHRAGAEKLPRVLSQRGLMGNYCEIVLGSVELLEPLHMQEVITSITTVHLTNAPDAARAPSYKKSRSLAM